MHRPAVAASNGIIYVTFDRYDNRQYSIHCARIDGNGSIEVEQVSPVTSDSWRFEPAVTVDRSGRALVVWLNLRDVVNSDGIVDQYPTIRGAVRTESGWELLRCESRQRDGLSGPEVDTDLAILAWGLLSVHGAGVWGYLGRRRKPLLINDNAGTPWLLWERKEEHDGSTPKAGGMVCGKRLDSADIESEPILFATGPRWYVPVNLTRNDRVLTLDFVARSAPPAIPPVLIYGRIEMDKSATDGSARLSEPGDWSDWSVTDVNTIVPSMKPEALGPQPVKTSTPAGNTRWNLYWADLHVHSGFSADAEGFMDELVHYAEEKAELDILLIQDNDHYQVTLTESEYELYLRYVARYHRDGELVMLPGYEWTYFEGEPRSGNHRTVFSADPRFPILRNTEAGDDPKRKLIEHARRCDATIHIHHQHFIPLDDAMDVNTEICSGWGAHMMHDKERSLYRDLQNNGYRLGYFGGSDNHRRNPGLGGALTGIFADSLTRNDVIAALRSHRCFATMGTRIVPRFWINDGFIGDELRISKPPQIRWQVSIPRPPADLTIYRDGERLASYHAETSFAEGELIDKELAPGSHHYVLEVIESGTWDEHPSNLATAIGPAAWTSPIWVERA